MTCPACGLPADDLHAECAEQAAELGVCVVEDEMPHGWLVDMRDDCAGWWRAWFDAQLASP